MAKIEDAIVDFIINNGTFYASLISQMHRQVDNKDTPSLAVSLKNGRITLKYNEEFVHPRSLKDTKAFLEHECMHITMDHHGRAKGKDLKRWKIATDLAINELLSHLPDDAITPERFFGEDFNKYSIKNLQNAEYYYELLEKSNEAKKKMNNGACGCGEKFENDGTSTSEDAEFNKEIIKQAVGEAIKSAKGQGNIPRGLEEYIDDLFKQAKVSWRTLLRQFVANSVKSGSKASWKKPSRRYGATQKGRIADRTVALTLVIDTSGSINDGVLKVFMDEVTEIQKCYKSSITVLECDAEVAHEYKLKKFEKLHKDVHGRGGTSFKPPFKYVKEKNIRTDALIYFTDLEGDFPTQKPNMPVLWAYYSNWQSSENPQELVPFGKVVVIEKDKK